MHDKHETLRDNQTRRLRIHDALREDAGMTIGCPDCGTLVEMPHPDTGGTTSCPTCEHTLERSSGR
ncbi:MAG: hypothetical protein L0H29_03480, partial [Sinobacteraceae bacterium]|nr:hypothetical protein [Nevskiaceae bacterium]